MCRIYEHRSEGTVDFGEHHHQEHQLVWMREGQMKVTLESGTWYLGADHFAWFPSSAVHHITMLTSGRMLSLYASAERHLTGERWGHAHPLSADPLSKQVLLHLSGQHLTPERKVACLNLLFDVLKDSTEGAPAALILPSDPRIRGIAQALLSDPADQRALADWSVELGVSAKTILRVFSAETAMTYGRWRTRARMVAAAEHLSRGESVNETAAAVGYTTASGFITAFSDHYGVTPGRYADATNNAGV